MRGAADISRGGVHDVGGITPLMKIVHLCESFGMRMEAHFSGVGHLRVLWAMDIPSQLFERGMLHPFLDYEQPPPWLNEIVDPMDEQGCVYVLQKPGRGMDISFGYIQAHRCG